MKRTDITEKSVEWHVPHLLKQDNNKQLKYLTILVKQSKRKKIELYLEIITCDTSNYTMDHPKNIASNQKAESIRA